MHVGKARDAGHACKCKPNRPGPAPLFMALLRSACPVAPCSAQPVAAGVAPPCPAPHGRTHMQDLRVLLPRLAEQSPLAQPVAGAHQRHAQQYGSQGGGGASARGGGGDLPCSHCRLGSGGVVRWDEQGVNLREGCR